MDMNHLWRNARICCDPGGLGFVRTIDVFLCPLARQPDDEGSVAIDAVREAAETLGGCIDSREHGKARHQSFDFIGHCWTSGSVRNSTVSSRVPLAILSAKQGSDG